MPGRPLVTNYSCDARSQAPANSREVQAEPACTSLLLAPGHSPRIRDPHRAGSLQACATRSVPARQLYQLS